MTASDDQPLPGGLFERTGDRFEPSDFTRGPWRPDAQHGGPPSALLVHLSERHVEPEEFLSHIEVELLRPVPLSTLEGQVTRTTVSRRVARVHATLTSAGTPVARSNALVLARHDLAPPHWRPDDAPALSPPPADATVDPPRWASGDTTTYHRNAVEHRFTGGTFREPGPAVDWQRLRLPLIAGEQTSGLERLAAAADFGSGISAVYPADSPVGLINANLSISLFRIPEGEWVSLDAVTHVGRAGTGLGVTQLGDVNGRVGVATQSLLGYDVG